MARKMVRMDQDRCLKAFDEALGDQLRGIRANRRFSRPKLAQLTGVNESSIKRYESGERSPEARTLYSLCRGLDVSPAELLAAAIEIAEARF